MTLSFPSIQTPTHLCCHCSVDHHACCACHNQVFHRGITWQLGTQMKFILRFGWHKVLVFFTMTSVSRNIGQDEQELILSYEMRNIFVDICWIWTSKVNKYEPNSQSQNTHGFPTILLPKNIAHLTIHRVAQISWQRRAFSRVTSFKVDKSDCNSFNLEAMAPVEDRGSSTCKLPKGDLHSRNQLIPCYSRKTNIAPENSCSQKESRTC